MTDKAYEDRRGGRYERSSKTAKPHLVEATKPSSGPPRDNRPAKIPVENEPAEKTGKNDKKGG